MLRQTAVCEHMSMFTYLWDRRLGLVRIGLIQGIVLKSPPLDQLPIPVLPFAMALAVIDSKIVFQKKVDALGLSSLWKKMELKGWVTYGSFAFATTFTPGVPTSPESLKTDIVEPLLGSDVDHADYALKPNLCRLHFQSYLFAMKDMQNQTDKADDDAKPVKIPAPERDARMRAMGERYTGLKFVNELEPSNILVDKCATIHSNGELRHIAWHELTTHDQEAQGVTTENLFKLDSNRLLKEVQRKVEQAADTGTEIKLRFALQRRGGAMHVAELLSFDIHEHLVSLFTASLNDEILADHQKVTIQQLHNADVQIFKEMAAATRGGFNVVLPGKMPLDDLLLKALESGKVKSLLAQKPRAVGSGGGTKRSLDEDTAAQVRQVTNNYKNNRGNSGGGKGAGGKGSGKAASSGGKKKGKQAKDATKSRLPAELIGLKAATKAGERICYNFNMEGCSAGKRCDKGWHVCMRCGSAEHGARSKHLCRM